VLIVLLVFANSNWPSSASKSLNGKRIPPQVPGELPFFGHLFQLLRGNSKDKSLFANLMLDWCKKYGPVFGFKISNTQVYVVSDVELGHKMFVEQGGRLNLRSVTIYSLSESTDNNMDIFCANGEVWRTNRKIFVQGVIRNLQRSEQIVLSVLEKTVDQIRDYGDAPILMSKLLRKQSSQVILDVAFGGIPLKKELHDQILSSIETILEYCSFDHPRNAFPILKYIPYEDRMRKAIKIRDQVLGQIFDDHLTDFKRGDPRDFVDVVMEHWMDGTIDDVHRRQILVDTFAGGTDTSATTIEFLLGYMANHPEIQRAAQEEIDFVLKGRVASAEDMYNLPLVNAIIMETMRLRPALPFVTRWMDQDVDLGDFVIPKNSEVWLYVYHLSMSREMWKDDPELFFPQRFLRPEEQDIKIRGAEAPKVKEHIKFAPFGIGPRSCPGYQLGKMEVFLQTTRLLQMFEWASVDQKPINLACTLKLIFKPKYEIKLRATPRDVHF
jgi:cytochrome P450